MSLSHRMIGFVALATLTAIGSTGCSSTEASGEDVGATEEAQTVGKCLDTVKAKVLERAFELSDTASIVSTHSLYADKDAFAEAILVRVSDETEPTDYVAIRSRLNKGVSNDNTCVVKKIKLVAEGLLPGDSLIRGKIGATCKSKIEAAILKRAKKLSDTASITGVKLVYGGDATFGGAAIVRVSDEVEPTDYVATFSLGGSQDEDKGTCKVGITELLNEGVLPKIAGL